eukprot:scaffold44029_cov53-Cyclotella_meneghiniana.AAC.2
MQTTSHHVAHRNLAGNPKAAIPVYSNAIAAPTTSVQNNMPPPPPLSINIKSGCTSRRQENNNYNKEIACVVLVANQLVVA